jgi:hypothetical protein
MITRRWIQAVLADAGVIELRHLPTGKSLIADDADKALAATKKLGTIGNVYSTLNRPSSAVLEARSALRDADIERIVFMPFDFDPVRPAGCASTDAEIQAGISARDAFVTAMASRGWPTPAIGMSGNGGHAVYRVFLRNDDGTRQMLKLIYAGLAQRYSDDEVHFDPTVRNPARIWRLYGTENRKGIATPDRPHRIAQVTIPADWRRVPIREIERLANEFAHRPEQRPDKPQVAKRISGRGDYATLDVVGWFRAHGHYVGHIDGRTHEARCPWELEHSSTSPRDTVIYESDGGWPGFYCHHQHCAGRDIRAVLALWTDADAFCSRNWRAA